MRSISCLVLVATLFISAGYLRGESNGMAPPAPTVVSTAPENGAKEVDPNLAQISVTFSQAMADKSWSWAYESKETFPETAGSPKYDEKFTTNTLPVKLEPGKTYVIWINTEKLKNFRSKAGVPAIPYKFTFSTKAAQK